MSRARYLTCLICACAVAMVAAPLSSSGQSSPDGSSRGLPQIGKVRASWRVSDHLASFKVVVRASHTDKVRSPGLPRGVRFERKSRRRFVARYSHVVAEEARADSYCQVTAFKLKAAGSAPVKVERRVCFRGR